MRDNRFITLDRGGMLTEDQHRKIIEWASTCSEHVLSLIKGNIDQRLIQALFVAKEWEEGKATTGDARKASANAHTVARESSDPVARAVARSIGHAVATAHMADHSIGAALYARRAIKFTGKLVDVERQWQIEQIPREMKSFILTVLEEKEKHFKI
ncbi:MAG: hypothetical protein PHI72_07475 [Atribacterota bacterium]|nr:hypothetical protein [Atribacterota bacterium]MDD5637590.1 hypothetical protein [Atribacterota bacterium]